jgi:hypothetical protein
MLRNRPDYSLKMFQIAESPSPSEQFSPPSVAELAELRDEFGKSHCVVLPALLDRALAHELARRVEQSDFYRLEHEGVGVEACMESNATLAWLLLLVNDKRMRDVVEAISGCAQIGHFDGRVYRLEPATEHYDSWHSDLVDNRLVAMSINLGTQQYEGGALQIRDRRTNEMAERRNPQIGDALLFELGEYLEHRVMPVAGESPRTVFAGWFKGGDELPLGTIFRPVEPSPTGEIDATDLG